MNSKTALTVAIYWEDQVWLEIDSFCMAHAAGDRQAKANACARLSQLGIMLANYFTDLTEATCIVDDGKPNGEMLYLCRESNKLMVNRVNEGIQSLGREPLPTPESTPKLPN